MCAALGLGRGEGVTSGSVKKRNFKPDISIPDILPDI